MILKESDPELSKNLAEFNVAFGFYRDEIGEVYPEHRLVLDTYLPIISDLAMPYGGTLFTNPSQQKQLCTSKKSIKD